MLVYLDQLLSKFSDSQLGKSTGGSPDHLSWIIILQNRMCSLQLLQHSFTISKKS